MVENKTWIGISIISLVLILSGIGYQITDKTYFCSEKGIVMDCVRFSSSGLRCYPNLLDNKGYKDCLNWVKLNPEDINKELNKTNEIPTENPTYSGSAMKYCCGSTCVGFNGNTECENKIILGVT